ncbi:hypothetical protein Q5O24_05550 [Eubacteriaceae bacterium ES3]|nr:hypothetical protein Q5O24_05550 [Eubacteriaceae bacterium ES3]
MKLKIFKQFGAAIASILIVYGIISTTYRSYQSVLAAQVESPDIVLVGETVDDVDTEITTPSVVVETTPAEVVETTETTEAVTETTETATTEAAAPVQSVTEESSVSEESIASAAPVQEDEIIVPDETASDSQTVVTEPDPVVPTLNEYLSQLRCGGCGKNCSLINPRCGRGQQKASNAQQEYYATYS